MYQADKTLYDYNLILRWNILVKPEKILLLNILYMDIDDDDADERSGCLSDHLRVRFCLYIYINEAIVLLDLNWIVCPKITIFSVRNCICDILILLTPKRGETYVFCRKPSSSCDIVNMHE